MSDGTSLQTASDSSEHPACELIRQWAADTLGIDPHASAEDCSR